MIHIYREWNFSFINYTYHKQNTKIHIFKMHLVHIIIQSSFLDLNVIHK